MASSSPTRTPGISPPSWSMAPTWPAVTADAGLRPKSRTSPRSAPSNPRTMEMIVVLPAPLGPRRATVSPRRTVRLRLSTAGTEP